MISVKIKNIFRDIPLFAPLMDEYRSNPRYEITKSSVFLHNNQSELDMHGNVINISITGMAFQFPESISKDNFVLDIIDDGEVLVSDVTAKVVWRSQKDSFTKYGVHFENLTSEQKNRLDNYFIKHSERMAMQLPAGFPR